MCTDVLTREAVVIDLTCQSDSVVPVCVDEGLTVLNVGRDAAGTYQCFVSNVAGTVSALASVVVTQRQQRPSDVQNIAPDGNEQV